MTEIVGQGAPVLRATTRAVPLKEIGSKKIQNIIARMSRAVESQEDGVAIAAPQIGESVRIFVIAMRTFEKERDAENDTGPKKNEPCAYINPVITKLSRSRAWVDEGCLSVRWLYGKVHRATKATVRAYDERGKPFERGASGLLAQIFQHEIDHLDGILFIDKAKEIVDLPPEKQ